MYNFSRMGFDTANASLHAIESIRSIFSTNSIFDFTLMANQDPMNTLKVKSEYFDQKIILCEIKDDGKIEFWLPPMS